MNKIIVTGGTGLVGKHLQKILPHAFYLSSEDCDLTDIEKVRWVISSYEPNIVIHLAAKVGVYKIILNTQLTIMMIIF